MRASSLPSAVLASLLLGLLCGCSTAKCCMSSQSRTNICGTCRAIKPADSTCAAGPEACVSDCGGVWCPDAALVRPVLAERTHKRPPALDVRRNAASASSICCFWAPADTCSSCQSKASGADWCAQSAENCKGCQGTWCADAGSPKTSAPMTAAPPKVVTSPAETTSDPPATRPTASGTKPSATTAAPVRMLPQTPASCGNWVEGTYVTGYWDCCKPSCSWPGKGTVTAPVRACKPDGSAAGPNDESVCVGGVSGSCPNNQPWMLDDQTSLGFTAAAVSGSHGLSGDANCGQCYQLVFTDQVHSDGNYGGAAASLVGKSHIVQITNIGYDVSGSHSFDLQIPGAGQGAFTTGCTKQYGGNSGDYDCDNNYGGCNDASGCSRLPPSLRAGCQWRYSWFQWLVDNGKTNNPYVKFRRVKCPKQLTDISGSIPLDDDTCPVVV